MARRCVCAAAVAAIVCVCFFASAVHVFARKLPEQPPTGLHLVSSTLIYLFPFCVGGRERQAAMQHSKNAEPPGLRKEQRSTRGKRMRAALEDESEGDAEFWNQVCVRAR